MPELRSPEEFLAASAVGPPVHELRSDCRALLLVVDGIGPEVASSSADELIARAETHARALLASSAVEDLPHVTAWRDAYRAFGAKPQRTRNSLEALTRRADETRAASFILDTLAPVTDAELVAAADGLAQSPPAPGSEARFSRRLVVTP